MILMNNIKYNKKCVIKITIVNLTNEEIENVQLAYLRTWGELEPQGLHIYT